MPVIELCDVCAAPSCYASEIEPSHERRARIAESIKAAAKLLLDATAY